MLSARGLWLYCLALAFLVHGFNFGTLLYRDAVVTPRSYLNESALGLGELAPRAVPQDWLLAWCSPVIPGSLLARLLIIGALLAAGLGCAALTQLLAPTAPTISTYVAATIAQWNPFVSERILQGHWSLLVGYAAIPWVIVLALAAQRHPHTLKKYLVLLIGCCAIAGLTPTGSLYVLFTLIVTLSIPSLIQQPLTHQRLAKRRLTKRRLTKRRWGLALAGLLIPLGTALPWLIVSFSFSSTLISDSAAVKIFAARAEPGLNTFGSLLGLGGIWNADAVPESRTGLWALGGTILLISIVALGIPQLWRRKKVPAVSSLFFLSIAGIGLPAFAATYWGTQVLHYFIENLPGFGLLRDTQKYVALAIPLYSVAGGLAVVTLIKIFSQRKEKFMPQIIGCTIICAIFLIVPESFAGTKNSLKSVVLPEEFNQAAATITPHQGEVLLYPPGTYRCYGFTAGPSLDPFPRLLSSSVLQTGELLIDGKAVDSQDNRASQAESLLSQGATSLQLAQLGVGWIIIEGTVTEPASRTLRTLTPIFSGKNIKVYQLKNPVLHNFTPSTVNFMKLVHYCWLLFVSFLLFPIIANVFARGMSRSKHSRNRLSRLRRP